MDEGMHLEGCQRLGNLILQVWSVLVTQQFVWVFIARKVWQP